MQEDPITVAQKAYQAYVAKDRAAIEAIIGDEFHFTSPLDNNIDRQTYFDRCWPNSERIAGLAFVYLISDGTRAFVTYEGRNMSGEIFRNTEILTVRNGKIVDVDALLVLSSGPVGHSCVAGPAS